MSSLLTLNDMLSPGNPLHACRVLACEERLSNQVSWAVSLRPYPPAFPQMRGKEIALVAIENLQRLDPPTSLCEVVRQLAARDASGVLVRGELQGHDVECAFEVGLPLMQAPPEAQLHDIEQAIMRDCALRQAISSVRAATPDSWLRALLAGEEWALSASSTPQTIVQGADYTIALILPRPTSVAGGRPAEPSERRVEQFAASKGLSSARLPPGIAVLLPESAVDTLHGWAAREEVACGIGHAEPLRRLARSLREAELALEASLYLCGGRPVRSGELGADRLLLVLRRHAPEELRLLVKSTLGPLVEHDRRAAAALMPTLSAFIEGGGRLRETATALSVHRNTLAYRLERAAALLGLDLDDAHARLSVALALRTLKLLDDPKE